MITTLLILVNAFISYRAYRAFESGLDRDDYLLRPFQLSMGKNFKGAILSQFSHVEIYHFIFNMLTLYFFGPIVEKIAGAIPYLLVYFASGISAIGLTYLQRKDDSNYSALGASGCVSGILFTSIVLFPGISLYMFFIPIPIPGPVFAILYMAYSLFLMNDTTGVSHEAHLGGALLGFLAGGYLAGGYQNFVNQFYSLF